MQSHPFVARELLRDRERELARCAEHARVSGPAGRRSRPPEDSQVVIDRRVVLGVGS